MNFKEVKQKIKTFIDNELISLEPWIVNSEWSEKLPSQVRSLLLMLCY